MIRKYIFSLLIAYAQNRINLFNRWIVVLLLSWDPNLREELRAIQHLQAAMGISNYVSPSRSVWRGIENKIVYSPVTSNVRPKGNEFWRVWAGGMSLVVFSLLLIWNVLPPGVILQWSTTEAEPVLFRVYRANNYLSGSFELLKEISPGTEVTSLDARVYSYQDIFLLPGQEYVYRVEMVDQNGFVTSQTIMSNAVEALPGQLALFLSFLIFCYGISLAIVRPANIGHLAT